MNSRKNYSKKKLFLWALAWVITTALVTFGSRFFWDSPLITSIAIVLSLAVGVGMILANRRFVNAGDELQRKIQLESMALTLGLTAIVGIAYAQLEQTHVITSNADISNLVLFMGITYLICIFINNRKYS